VLAWRLCRESFADLTGEGGRRFGGRRNAPGCALLYAASSAALAVLEVRVHLDLVPNLLPVLLTTDLDELAVEELTRRPTDPVAFGNDWLREQRTFSPDRDRPDHGFTSPPAFQLTSACLD
jgi:RES domain-containing protein